MNAISMKNITMKFGSFKANDNINLVVKKGEIHALIGENGAGKSTLMSILFGLYKPSKGYVMINEEVVNISSPLMANKLGIGMVHQHFKLVENFTVLENILLNIEESNIFGLLTYKKAREKVELIMKKYGFEVKLNKKIINCSVAEQQRVEIIKMLYRDAEVLIFDEPTAVLSPIQINEFLKALIDLKNKGKTIIIITHKLGEIKQIADSGTVIRKGK
jgi:simple sugar transport system ATP-binding protein